MNQVREPITPGIIVLSSSLNLLHINQRAIHLLTQLGRSASRLGADRSMTAPLPPLSQDIIETMRARLALNHFELFHCAHTIIDSERAILVKGFGLPNQNSLPH